jgi:hypothetical protein
MSYSCYAASTQYPPIWYRGPLDDRPYFALMRSADDVGARSLAGGLLESWRLLTGREPEWTCLD